MTEKRRDSSNLSVFVYWLYGTVSTSTIRTLIIHVAGSYYTVTSYCVDFCYPDRVPLTQFVHIAKKFWHVGLNFRLSFQIFWWCNWKIFEHRLDLQIMNQIFYHCATASLFIWCYVIHCVPCWDFPAVSEVTGSRIFRPYLVVTCRDFLAVSAFTGSRNFRPYL